MVFPAPSCAANWLKHQSRRIPLRVVLIVPFVMQTVAAVSLTGWLALRNGERAVSDVATRYRAEITSRIQQELRSSLDIPHRINQANANAIRLNLVDFKSPEDLERFFWQQLYRYREVNYVYAGNPEGGIIGVGSPWEDIYRSYQTEDFVAGNYLLFQTTRYGRRNGLIGQTEGYDARDRPWYQAAIRSKEAAWSDIYLYAGEKLLGIAASLPIYDDTGQLQGVLATDFVLEQISDFLRELDIGYSGQTFVVEQTGHLVASSTDESPFIQIESDDEPKRRHVFSSNEPLIVAASEHLTQQYESLGQIKQAQDTTFEIEGDRHFLRVVPFQDGRGLDWLIVVVIPESDFMAQIHDNTHNTLLMGLAALGVVLLSGIATARWITHPISKLSKASQAIAEGQFHQLEQTVDIDREDEVGVLAHSFNRMAAQLRQAFKGLERRTQELEERVAERTAHLLQANRQLQQQIEERKRITEQLQTSEQKYRALHEGSQDSVTLFDGKSFVECNTATLKMFGCETREQFCGRHPFDFSPPQQPRGENSAALGEEKMAIAQRDGACNFEWMHQRLDGTPFWADVRLSAVTVGGQPMLQAVIRDMTQRKQAEKALHRAKETAEVASRAKSEFLAHVSHELRTPLNGILGYAQTLQRLPDLSPKQRDGLHVIQQCGDHLLTLINDILDLSKIEARKMELNPVEFSLTRLLADLVDLFHLRSQYTGLSFRYDRPTRLPQAVCGDEQKLRQVLMNLLGNAFKFTQQGQVTLRIQAALAPPTVASSSLMPSMISASRSAQGRDRMRWLLRFEVEDTGVGIAADQLEAIFQPFQQVGNVRQKHEGTGLGLSISKQLIELMGGTLQVHSTPGKGSRFSVDLELLEVPQPNAQNGGDRLIVGYQGPPKKVLIVDDTTQNRRFLAELLSSVGFITAEAADGETGLVQAVEFRPDLILMDLVMPGMDGLTATQRIRNTPDFAAIRDVVVIATSASIFDADQQRSSDVGCNGFLPKPIQTSELLDQIQSHLALRWLYDDSRSGDSNLGDSGSENSSPDSGPDDFYSKRWAEDGSMKPHQVISKDLCQTENCHKTHAETVRTLGRLSDDLSLVFPHPSVLAELQDLARVGDIQGIVTLVEKLEHADPQLVPFADTLRQLAKTFQMRKIRNFLNARATGPS